MTATVVMTYGQVMEKLPAIVAECLAIDLEEVTPDLVFSHVGESIDWLDLNFQCEKTFGIKSPFRLFIGSRDDLQLDDQGNLTSDSLRLIRETYPFFAEKLHAAGAQSWQPKDLQDLVTVDVIARFILHAANNG